jgi:UPF0755 protein
VSRGRNKGGRLALRLLVLAAFFVLVAGVGAFAYKTTQSLFGSETAPAGETAQTETDGELVRVTIPSGLSAADVARILEREGVIDSTSMFLLRVRLKGAGASLKPGEYEFRKGEDHDRIIAELEEGVQPEPGIRVTLPEGLSIDQTAERLDQQDIVDGGEYHSLAERPEEFDVPMLGGTTIEIESLEGLLFPDTYELRADETAEGLIRQQLAAFSRATEDLPWENAAALGISPYQVVIVASLIEKEARVAEERSLVSAVVYNRLAQDMTLGIDATTRYAVKKWTGPLTRSDLDDDSPYNTRKNGGLPPGPIASPGLAALRAALEPEEVDYLYYVLQDEEGHHFFTASYEEFLRAKANAPSQ